MRLLTPTLPLLPRLSRLLPPILPFRLSPQIKSPLPTTLRPTAQVSRSAVAVIALDCWRTSLMPLHPSSKACCCYVSSATRSPLACRALHLSPCLFRFRVSSLRMALSPCAYPTSKAPVYLLLSATLPASYTTCLSCRLQLLSCSPWLPGLSSPPNLPRLFHILTSI